MLTLRYKKRKGISSMIGIVLAVVLVLVLFVALKTGLLGKWTGGGGQVLVTGSASTQTLLPNGVAVQTAEIRVENHLGKPIKVKEIKFNILLKNGGEITGVVNDTTATVTGTTPTSYSVSAENLGATLNNGESTSIPVTLKVNIGTNGDYTPIQAIFSVTATTPDGKSVTQQATVSLTG